MLKLTHYAVREVGKRAVGILMERFLFTTCKRSLRRLCFYRCLSVHGGGHAWQGEACMVGGCMAGGMCGRGCAWQGACVDEWQGGMHGGGGMCGSGHAWQGACVACPQQILRDMVIRSMSGQYASYWNAFFLFLKSTNQCRATWEFIHCYNPWF